MADALPTQSLQTVWRELTAELSKKVALLQVTNERQLLSEWRSLLRNFNERAGSEAAAKYSLVFESLPDALLDQARILAEQRLAKAELDKQNELAVAHERAEHQNGAIQALYAALEDEHKREIEANQQLKAECKKLEQKVSELYRSTKHLNIHSQDTSIAAGESERQLKELSAKLVDAEFNMKEHEDKLVAIKRHLESTLHSKQDAETELLKLQEELRHAQTRIVEVESELIRNEPGSWDEAEAQWDKLWKRVQRELEETKLEDFSAVYELLNTYFERYERQCKGWRRFQVFFLHRHDVYELMKQYHEYVGEELSNEFSKQAKELQYKHDTDLLATKADADKLVKEAQQLLAINVESTKSQLSDELNVARRELQAKTRELEGEKLKFSDEKRLAQSLKAKLDELESTEKSLQKVQNMNQDALRRLEKERDDAASAAANWQTLYEEQKLQSELLSREKGELQEELREIQSKAERLQSTIDQELTNMSEASSETLQRQAQEQLERILGLQESLEAERGKGISLQRDISNLTRENGALKASIGSEREQAELCKTKLTEVSRDLTGLTESHRALQVEYQEALQQMKAKDLRIQKLEKNCKCVIM